MGAAGDMGICCSTEQSRIVTRQDRIAQQTLQGMADNTVETVASVNTINKFSCGTTTTTDAAAGDSFSPPLPSTKDSSRCGVDTLVVQTQDNTMFLMAGAAVAISANKAAPTTAVMSMVGNRESTPTAADSTATQVAAGDAATSMASDDPATHFVTVRTAFDIVPSDAAALMSDGKLATPQNDISAAAPAEPVTTTTVPSAATDETPLITTAIKEEVIGPGPQKAGDLDPAKVCVPADSVVSSIAAMRTSRPAPVTTEVFNEDSNLAAVGLIRADTQPAVAGNNQDEVMLMATNADPDLLFLSKPLTAVGDTESGLLEPPLLPPLEAAPFISPNPEAVLMAHDNVAPNASPLMRPARFLSARLRNMHSIGGIRSRSARGARDQSSPPPFKPPVTIPKVLMPPGLVHRASLETTNPPTSAASVNPEPTP
ncbi:hypothetical protein Vretimale_13140 [Volvox reticuliferus]|nr:hypothetical protein Vretimale_13140 [Volvox reticuliferus]